MLIQESTGGTLQLYIFPPDSYLLDSSLDFTKSRPKNFGLFVDQTFKENFDTTRLFAKKFFYQSENLSNQGFEALMKHRLSNFISVHKESYGSNMSNRASYHLCVETVVRKLAIYASSLDLYLLQPNPKSIDVAQVKPILKTVESIKTTTFFEGFYLQITPTNVIICSACLITLGFWFFSKAV